ncbi:MAG: DUF4249 family protein [Bacteroidota bacterium]
MLSNFKYFLLLALAALSFACESDLDVPFPEHEPRLALNAYFTTEEAPTIYLNQSVSKDQPLFSNYLVPDATASLWSEGQLIGDFVYRDTVIQIQNTSGSFREETLGKYELVGTQLETGKSYEVRADHPDFPEIRAETLIPSATSMRDFTFEPEVSRRANETGTVFEYDNLIKFSFDDPAGEANSYFLEMDIRYSSPGMPDDTAVYISLGQPVAADLMSEELSITQFGSWFRDSLRDGQTIDAVYRFTTSSFDANLGSWTSSEEIYSISLNLINANELTYQYLQKIQQQNRASSQDFFDLFPPESINVPSNVEGGYGLLGGLSLTRERYEF